MMIATAASPNQTTVQLAQSPIQSGGGSIPSRIGDWLVDRFGAAARPIAIGAGAVAGGALGFFTLGPIAGIVGAIGGGLLGAQLIRGR